MTDTTTTTPADDTAMQALSDAGAICGECGDEPGDRDCPDCERCYRDYVAALRKAGWAPRAETLLQAISVARTRADAAGSLADAEDAHRRAERAEQQAAHVRALHRTTEGPFDTPYCEQCGYAAPCPTIRALDAAGQPDCPGETDPPTCNCPCEGCQHHCAAHQPDTCRTVDIDGETIRVRGAGDPADTREEASR